MKQITVFLVVLAAIMFSASALSELDIEPVSTEACCGTVKYVLLVSNDQPYQRFYSLKATADEGITVELAPDVISVDANSKETLMLVARHNCDENRLAPGAYSIQVTAKCEVCANETYIASAKLVVPDSCTLPVRVSEPKPEENNTTVQTEVNETEPTKLIAPTGMAVSSKEPSSETTLPWTLAGVFACLSIALAIIIIKK